MTMILIVDDDKVLVNLVYQSLIFEQYLAEIAYDGAEARKKLADPIFDFIILDWDLPDATGPQLLQEYRRAGGSARCHRFGRNVGISHRRGGGFGCGCSGGVDE